MKNTLILLWVTYGCYNLSDENDRELFNMYYIKALNEGTKLYLLENIEVILDQ